MGAPATLLACALAALLQQEEPSTPPTFEELVERVERREDDYFAIKARRSAVRRLADAARGGEAELWEPVVLALSDPAPMVADEAELQLGTLTAPDWIEALAGRDGLRSRLERVPLRVAQAFGRLAVPVDGRVLADRLDERDPELRRMLLWSLERLARAGGLRAEGADEVRRDVARACDKAREPGVRAAALAALAALEPVGDGGPGGSGAAGTAWPRLLRALEDREPEPRCAALALLAGGLAGGEGGDPAARAARVAAHADDASVAVRTQAVLALAELGTRDALLALVDRLEAEPELRLRWRILERLRWLTGRRHPLDAQPWKHWASTLPPDWEPVRADPDAGGDGGDGGDGREVPGFSDATFAQLPLRSEKVALLVDFSGSIWGSIAGGRSYKEWLDEELERALASFPEDGLLNLIPYTHEPLPWHDAAVPATDRNRRKAVDWFRGRKDDGLGNFWDAALLALDDPSVDTLLVFTDGAPSGGHRWNMDLIVDLLLERNRFRHATIDSVLIGSDAGRRKRWSRLSEATGGRSIVLDVGRVAAEDGAR